MADIKGAFSSTNTLTVTNLHSLANSATVVWACAVIDNTTTLYEDALVQIVLDFANTAPANDKCAYVYAYGGIESGVYSDPISGSEGTFTLATIVSNAQTFRQIGVIPYNTQDAVVESQPFAVAPAFGGILAPYWGIVVANYSGAALAASGNTAKWRGVYRTV